MLSATAEYALRAILTLVRVTSVDAEAGTEPGAMRADAIADAIGAPRNYLAKTLNVLAKAGLLVSTRGPSGGFALAVAPETLTIAQIVDLFDEPHRIPVCLLGARPCNAAAPCRAHRRWTEITAARRQPFASTTVADLLDARPTLSDVVAA
jgi:Rrf2 family protein